MTGLYVCPPPLTPKQKREGDFQLKGLFLKRPAGELIFFSFFWGGGGVSWLVHKYDEYSNKKVNCLHIILFSSLLSSFLSLNHDYELHEGFMKNLIIYIYLHVCRAPGDPSSKHRSAAQLPTIVRNQVGPGS